MDRLEAFVETYAAVSAANRRTLGKLEELLVKLEERGVEVILLKGADLSTRVYGALGLRCVGDADLLAREKDLPALDEAARAAGLRPRIDGNPAYIDSEDKFVADVALDVWYMPDTTPLWERSRVSPFLGARARRLDPTDALLYSCAWSCLHRGYFTPQFAEDVERLVASEPVDWDRLLADARAYGLRMPLRRALIHARDKRKLAALTPVLARLSPSGLGERAASALLDRLVLEKRLVGLGHLLVALTRPRGARLKALARGALPGRRFLSYRYGERSGASLVLIRAARPFYLAWSAAGLAARIALRLAGAA